MSSSCESIFPPDERDNGIGWLEKTQLVLKRMLFILDDVCKKHEIEYFIIGGTLLGAYRTESFIPWDGDVDVGMMENHYNRFCEVVEKELPNDIFFQSKQKEIAGYDAQHIVKLRDRYSNYVEYQEKNPSTVCHNGIQLDIFMHRKTAEDNILCIDYPSSIHPKDIVFPLSSITFCNRKFPAPRNVEEFLKKCYGSLSLPPAEKRHPHELRVSPYTPCNHKESLQWYDGNVTCDLNDNQGIFIFQISILFAYATKTRRNVLIYFDPNNNSYSPDLKKIMHNVKLYQQKNGENDLILPPTRFCDNADEYKCIKSAENYRDHVIKRGDDEIPPFPNSKNIALYGNVCCLRLMQNAKSFFRLLFLE